MCPPHTTYYQMPYCVVGVITPNPLIKGNCKLGIGGTGQPTSILCLLLRGLRLSSPSIFIRDHFVPSCSQDLQITCGGILPRTSVGYFPDVDSFTSYFAGNLSLSPDFDSSLFTVPQKSARSPGG